MKKLSSTKRDQIIVHLNNGLSVREISMKTKIGKSTIGHIRLDIGIEDQSAPQGRPKKLSAQDIRLAVRKLSTGQLDNVVQVSKHLNSMKEESVHPETVRRAVKNEGMKAVVKKKKPLLSKYHKKARLAFAHKYKEWTEEDWAKVIWSDESKINLLGSDGHTWIWKKKGEGLIDREVQGTKKFGGGNIMVWGCMGWDGVGICCEVEGRMDGQQYVNILEQCLLESITKFGLEKDDVIFQQDNDPKHTCKLATEWFQNEGLDVLDWPAQFPDLNPIEHLWFILKRYIYDYPEPATGVFDLWNRVTKAWAEITQEQVRDLIKSMPRRIEAVIKAKGGNTKY